MKHVSFPPAAKRQGVGSLHPKSEVKSRIDPRWHCLDLLRKARACYGIKDRDIAVLRGLLSLLPVEAWGGQMVIFASNRTLIDRCDGIEERTLRRRLAHLVELGIIARKQSPNGKRYQLRGADGAALLTYGFDLTPLCQLEQALPEQVKALEQMALDAAHLKAQIRDRLYHLSLHTPLPCSPVLEHARLSLRRVISLSELTNILTELDQLSREIFTPEANEMSVSNGQNVRHIQSSYKEDLNKDAKPISGNALTSTEPRSLHITSNPSDTVSLNECIEAAPNAVELSPNPVKTWTDLTGLAQTLAPAIGISPHSYGIGIAKLGHDGAALAVLGLVQAMNRIRKPAAYFAALVQKADGSNIHLGRMFRSLTATNGACIPG